MRTTTPDQYTPLVQAARRAWQAKRLRTIKFYAILSWVWEKRYAAR